jgi:hypothetical protein
MAQKDQTLESRAFDVNIIDERSKRIVRLCAVITAAYKSMGVQRRSRGESGISQRPNRDN